jgi:hypothetical protein
MPTKKSTREEMTLCEVEIPFKRNNVKTWEWSPRSIASITSFPPKRGIRCAFCHGSVKVVKRKSAEGPTHHLAHISAHDVERCTRGEDVAGRTHKMSAQPVT